MKTTWLPLNLSLSLGRAALRPTLLALPLFAGASIARAQEGPRITFPQPNQDVRGEISARFEGIPAGGYAIIKVNGQFKTATAQNTYALDTIADNTTFNGDGQYTLEITALNAGGRTIGTTSVQFNVANEKVADTSEAVLLTHWVPSDRLKDGVQRYRVFAESNADIQESTSGGGAGGSSGGGESSGGRGGPSAGGSAGGGADNSIPAPLDWQVSVLLRREVRDVYGFQNSANIATAIAEAWQHQRESEAGGTGAEGGGPSGGSARGGSAAGSARSSKKAAAPSAPVKAPWASDWMQGPEFAKFYVKAIQQTGDEINATRKANTVAIADLLPTFLNVPVRPGSTWRSRQSILSDLSTRKPINIEGSVTFTAYENIQTPGGASRRCAKIESRFPLPDGVAKRIAADLGSKVSTTGGAGGSAGSSAGAGAGAVSGGGAEGGAAAEPTLLPEDIEVAQFNMARVIWFDMDRHQVVRSEDNLRAYFEIPPSAAGGAEGGASGPTIGSGGGLGGEGGAAAEPAEPTKVNYSMNVTTWLDDRLPSPTLRYTGGANTAHSRDNVTEPGLGRVTKR